jgi:hypothetical protein
MHVNQIKSVFSQLTYRCESPVHVRTGPSIERNRSAQNHFLVSEHKATFNARFSRARPNHSSIGSPTN